MVICVIHGIGLAEIRDRVNYVFTLLPIDLQLNSRVIRSSRAVGDASDK